MSTLNVNNLSPETGNQTVIEAYGENVNAIGSTGGGTQDINLALGNVVTATVDTSAAPTLTTSGRDVLTFTTVDGGTIWYGFAAGLDMK